MSDPSRLRVLYAAPGLVLVPGGGPCEHFLSVARGLARCQDIDLDLLIGAPARDGVVPEDAGFPENARVHLLPLPRNAWAVTDSLALGSHPLRYLKHRRSVVDIAEKIMTPQAPDVVFERMWGFGGILGSALSARGSRWILEENGPPGFEFRRRRVTDILRGIYLAASRYRTRGLYRRASRVIVQTDALKSRLVEQFAAPAQRIEVIANAVDRSLLEVPCERADRDAARAELGLPADRPLLLYTGSLDRNHHVRRVVEAFLSSGRPQGSALLLVMGIGYDRHAIEALLRRTSDRNGGRCDVTLVDPQPRHNLQRYLCAADLALAPYDRTSFPRGRFGFSSLKVREYLAFELPVAATTGTASDLIEHGRNGFLVDEDAAWRRLFQELPDRDELSRMGRGGRRRVSAYTYDDVARRYVEVARAALEVHSTGTPVPA